MPENLQKVLTAPPPEGSLTAENFVEAVNDLHARCNNDMARIGFGPLAPQWCTDELLLAIRKAAQDLNAPIPVHAVQSIYQKVYGLEFLGKTLIQHMQDIGFLGKKKGWTVIFGGNSARRPRIGDVLVEDVSKEEALEVSKKCLEYYVKNARKMERTARFIERIGIEELKKNVL